MKKFTELEYKRPDLEIVKERFESLIKKFDEAKNFTTQEDAIKEINALREDFSTAASLASVRNTIDISNQYYDIENSFFDQNGPLFSELNIQFYRSLSQSAYQADLRQKFGNQLFDLAEASVRSFDAKITTDVQNENKQSTEYSKRVAGAEIEFDGKTLNLAGLEPYAQSTDRTVRKAALDTNYGWWEKNADFFDKNYDDLVKTRTAMAKKMGYSNFVEMGYDRMNRTDYTAADVAKFRQQVVDFVVPLSVKLRERQAKRLGVDKLSYYDFGLNFLSGNPTPKGDPDWILENGKKMYAELSPETKEFFDFMTQYELLDLVNKKNKQAGGYCTHFSKYKAPFIFSNFNGTSHDIDVLTHEAGHAFQCYQSRNQPIEEYLWPTYEACEIHSMSMEFFAWPWMETFFKEDTDKYKFQHLSAAILFLPYGCAVDEFQHLVYANPNMTPAERNDTWLQMEKKYRPWLNYEDNAYLNSGGLWKRQAHIYRSPFYYIDYCLAQICALQFWSRSQSDFKGAWADYLTLCKAGGSKPFIELVKLAGLNNPFNESTVKPVITEIKDWLDGVDDSKF
jgi:M3 family oligoendopeptidase